MVVQALYENFTMIDAAPFAVKLPSRMVRRFAVHCLASYLGLPMSDVAMQPVQRPFSAEISPPGSKSMSNRAMVLAALAEGSSTLANVLFADDTRVMIDALRELGFDLKVDEAEKTVGIHGAGGDIPRHQAELMCGNSGTTIRFLTAMVSLGRGEFVLDGIARMRQRPIGQLIDLLRHAGVRTQYQGEDGFPPVKVLADRLPGGLITFGAAQSSQFLSAMLMIAPQARIEMHVDLIERQTSWPYVAMTMRMMDQFHLTPELIRDPETQEPRQIIVPRGRYVAQHYAIEPDASNASYFLAAAAIHKGSKVTVHGLGRQSLQGDVGFADVLHRMGAGLIFGEDFITVMGADHLEGIDVDLSGMPDTAQTLAVAALFAESESTLRGLHTLRVKETDRLAALSNELTRLGARVEIGDDTLTIRPPKQLNPAQIETYDDHRMAMSFALAGTKSPGVVIRDAECVNKTYPEYFGDLETVIRKEI